MPTLGARTRRRRDRAWGDSTAPLDVRRLRRGRRPVSARLPAGYVASGGAVRFGGEALE